MTPAVEGILPIVALADPGLTPVVEMAVAGFKGGVILVTTDYNAWKAGSTAAQPGVLAQLEADLNTLRMQSAGLLSAAHVKNPVHASVISGIMSAVIDEIGEIAGFIGQTKTAGGTTAAAEYVLASYGREAPEPQTGNGTTTSTHVKLLHGSKHFKKELKAHLLHKTGNAALDAANTKTAAKLK
jgi:hypothetical protein